MGRPPSISLPVGFNQADNGANVASVTAVARRRRTQGGMMMTMMSIPPLLLLFRRLFPEIDNLATTSHPTIQCGNASRSSQFSKIRGDVQQQQQQHPFSVSQSLGFCLGLNCFSLSPLAVVIIKRLWISSPSSSFPSPLAEFLLPPPIVVVLTPLQQSNCRHNFLPWQICLLCQEEDPRNAKCKQ